MTDITPIQVFNVVYPYVISYIAGHGGALLFTKIRARIHGLRQLIDIMDDAMVNQNVTEAQAQATWKLVKARLDSSVT